MFKYHVHMAFIYKGRNTSRHYVILQKQYFHFTTPLIKKVPFVVDDGGSKKMDLSSFFMDTPFVKVINTKEELVVFGIIE